MGQNQTFLSYYVYFVPVILALFSKLWFVVLVSFLFGILAYTIHSINESYDFHVCTYVFFVQGYDEAYL